MSRTSDLKNWSLVVAAGSPDGAHPETAIKQAGNLTQSIGRHRTV